MATFTIEIEEEIEDDEVLENILTAMEDVVNKRGYTLQDSNAEEF